MEGYVDLALSQEEIEEQHTINTPLADVPKYPWGLSISMDEKTLAKLNVDHGDWEVGDIFPVDILLKVTGKNASESQDGERCCINMQIIGMKGEEAESEVDAAESALPDLKPHGYLRYSS